MRGEGEKKNVIKIWLLTISSGFRDILDTNLAVFGSWRLMFFFWFSQVKKLWLIFYIMLFSVRVMLQ